MNVPLKFVNHKIEENALHLTYDPIEKKGNIIYNLSLINTEDLEFAIKTFKEAYSAGLCVSDRILIAKEGDKLENFVIPKGKTGICTICSLVLDSLLYQRGVPLNPIGGGLVEVENLVPRRFTAMIQYEYTTIDPITVMISQGNTSVMNVIKTGSGTITGNIRECHMESESAVFDVLDVLNEAGFVGVLDVGVPNTPLLGVPVTPNYIGISMIGGTNPIAGFKETGRWAEIQSMKGLMDISSFEYLENY
ncbi:DUF128 domain-containing protein [Methanoplanus sp. FWC-SCC4]|uniref:DUF128 domain-containing protein n=1 Tax=Methanochimaera problematica TaxID=2609417 RepID=A0AA97I312_9EURY|nr:DUF128 domain-containing protein [Methanoplanus sp. FWC-SCC4]WOF16183.1 DUF128 domain-containing protein [Methanoplanus sp. FWC-SCC4]